MPSNTHRGTISTYYAGKCPWRFQDTITAGEFRRTYNHNVAAFVWLGLRKPREIVLPPRSGFDLAPGLFLRIVQEETFLNVPKMPYHDGLRGVLRGDRIAKAAELLRRFRYRKGVKAQLRRLLEWWGPGSLVAMLQDVMADAGFSRVAGKLDPAFHAGCSEEEALEEEGKWSW